MKKFLSFAIAAVLLVSAFSVIAFAAAPKAADFKANNGFFIYEGKSNKTDVQDVPTVADSDKGVKVVHGGYYASGDNCGGVVSVDKYELDGFEATVVFEKVPEVTAETDCWVAFDIDTIVLSPKTVDLYNSKVIRSTQGMMFHINIIVSDIEEIVNKLKKDNYKIYGTKVDSGADVRNINNIDKYALIIGNEGNGMSDGVSRLCDEYLYIKMNNNVESLNAGVAASILLYEMAGK